MIGKIEFGTPGYCLPTKADIQSMKEMISELQKEVAALKNRVRHLEVKGMVCR